MNRIFRISLFFALFCLAPLTATAQTPNTGWYTANPSAPVFTISTADELAGLAQIVNGTWGGSPAYFNFNNRTVNLANSINLSAYGAGYNGGAGWNPIGTGSGYNGSFSGTFDGNGNVITGLYINRNTNYSGLFGYVTGGASTVKNLVVDSAYIISGTKYVGTIAGYITSGGITNCSVRGGSVAGKDYAGGIAGYVHSSGVTGSYFSGSINGNNNIGGVAGYVNGTTANGGSVTNCYSTGTVEGNTCVGGVAGYLYNSDMANCYSTASVSGVSNVGGLVGRQIDGSVTNCYFTGFVNGISNYVGGLTGYLTGGVITNSYSASPVSGDSSLGGLAGALTGGGIIEYCAALNPSVTKFAASGSIGRIAGIVTSGGILNNNLAWDSVAINKTPLITGPNTIDGANITTSQIFSDSSIGGLFINNGNPWVTAAGSLPGFGTPVIMPGYLIPGSGGGSDLAALISQIENAAFSTAQANVTNITQANAAVLSIIDSLGLSLAGITVAVNDSTFTPAEAGTSDSPFGVYGSYLFRVTLSDTAGGAFTTTSTLSLRIVPTSFGVLLAALISRIEAAAFSTTQDIVTDTTEAKAAVQTVINALNLGLDSISVTLTVNGSTFTPAIAGTLGNPPGINGSYQFTVVLKGISIYGASDTTSLLTLGIAAAPYELRKRAEPAPVTAADYYDAVSVSSNEFTAGPNPVAKHSGSVNFFWQGRAVKNEALFIYDASGNLIKKINISDKSIGKSNRRAVGKWDLKDSKGRAVSEGTYIVKGKITYGDGKSERVSLMLGIR